MQEQSQIDVLLRQNYKKYPYPNDLQDLNSEQEQRHLEMYRLFLRSLNLSLEQVTAGLVLDIGCGTGDTAIRRFARWNAKTVGLDLTPVSLRVAKANMEKLGFSNVCLVNGSALGLPFPDEHFDVVHSCGVLHCTGDTYAGFREMVRVCKKGGVVIIGVYNQFGGFGRTAKRTLLRLIAGNDVEKQMSLAAKIFGVPKHSGGMPSEVYLNDTYGHPHEFKHSYGELLEWFRKNDIEYLGSYPSLDFARFWNVLCRQILTSKNRRIQKISKVTQYMSLYEGTERDPNMLKRSVTQSLMLLIGQEMFNLSGIRG